MNHLWVFMLEFSIRVYDRICDNEFVSWSMLISYLTLYDMILIPDYLISRKIKNFIQRIKKKIIKFYFID